MSAAPDQTPRLVVQCPNPDCGRENGAGRLFCQVCGWRLPAPPVEPPPPPAPLPVVPDDNQNLRQQLESMIEELNRAKTASAKLEASLGGVAELRTKLKSAEEKAATLESQSAEWEKKWKSAEEKAASFQKQMDAKAKEVAAAFQQNPDAKSNQRSKLIAGTLVMLGILGGYGAGRFAQPKDDSKGRVNQLLKEVTNAQGQISNLKSLLESTNQNANQVENDLKLQLNSANEKIRGLTKTSTVSDGQQQLIKKLQRDLASTATQLNAAIANQHSAEELATQRLAQQTASNQRVQQLQADLHSRDTEVSALRKQIANPTRPPTPLGGFMLWSGTVSGKHKINIKNNVADYGNVSGELPQTPCAISRLSFEVFGTGPVQVRINCGSAR